MLDIVQDGARWRTVVAEIYGRGVLETVELEYMVPLMCPRFHLVWVKEANVGAKDMIWMERVIRQCWERFTGTLWQGQ